MEIEWINRKLVGSTDPGEVESRLRTALEETQGRFLSSTQTVMTLVSQIAGRVPVATVEISNLRRRASELQGHLEHLSALVGDLQSTLSDSVEVLARIDQVKQKMERCVDALVGSELLVQGLHSLSPLLGSAPMEKEGKQAQGFSLGEIQSFAAQLVDLRRHYAPLREIPTFRRQREELIQLESALLLALNAKFVDALHSFDAQTAATLAAVYGQLEATSTMTSLFIATHMELLAQLLQKNTSATTLPQSTLTLHLNPNLNATSIPNSNSNSNSNPNSNPNSNSNSNPNPTASNLDNALIDLHAFYTQSALFFSTIASETLQVFSSRPQSAAACFQQLVGQALHSVSAPLARTLAKKSLPEVLQAFLQAQALQRALTALPGDLLADSPRWEAPLLEPFAPLQRAYCQLERAFLAQELGAALSAVPGTFQAAVQRVGDDGERLFAALNAAVGRWMGFVDAAQGEDFVFLLNEVLTGYLNAIIACFDFLRAEARLDAVVPAASNTASPHLAKTASSAAPLPKTDAKKGALQMTRLKAQQHDWQYFQGALTLQRYVDRLRALLNDLEHVLADEMQRGAGGGGVARKKQLFPALDVHQRLASLTEAFVFDTMFCFVKEQLAAFPALEAWRGAGQAGQEGQEIPSLYLIEIKEYILSMPELLEPFALAQVRGGEDPAQVIVQWISTVCRSTMTTLEQRVLECALEEFSAAGVAQLQLDIQHLANVLRAFGVELSHGLRQIMNQLEILKKEK